MGTLVILRHGETIYNRERRMTGRADIPLTDKGEEQAREAGRLLPVFRFDAVYSSTLSRAFNTAVLAVDASRVNRGIRIIQDARLDEADVGDFTGLCHLTAPEIRNYQRSFGKKIPGGESDKDVYLRVRAFYESEIVPRLARGETVMIACHSGIVRAFDLITGQMPLPDDDSKPDFRRVENARPEVYHYKSGRIEKGPTLG